MELGSCMRARTPALLALPMYAIVKEIFLTQHYTVHVCLVSRILFGYCLEREKPLTYGCQ